MSALEKAIIEINVSSRRHESVCTDVDPRIQLIVVIAFIIDALSIPVDDPASLLWLFCFPIIMSEAIGIGYGAILKKSLWVLPLVALVGIFNPLTDRVLVWHIGTIAVNRGWLTFIALIIRGILTFQALLLLIHSYGFYDICRTLQYFHFPKVFVTQMLMLYRYIGVLLSEALDMHRARQSRGYGKRHYPLSMWGVFIGQLLLRSVERARRVNDAMVSRGFAGVYHFERFANAPSIKNYLYLCVWIALFAALRYYDITAIVARIITHHI